MPLTGEPRRKNLSVMVDARLYGRLFRYRARERRAPLEDYLTEGLADLLGRMPTDVLSHLLDDLVGPAGAWSPAAAAARITWSTQTICDGKLADLVMWLDGKPAVVVESKLHSRLREHGPDANQLSTYGCWLAERRDPLKPSALVLLTLGTAAPDDFGEGDAAAARYGIERRTVVTWPRLARRLRGLARSSAGSVWATLAHEFVDFLGDKGMATETIMTADVSAAHLFLPGWNRWEGTFASLWTAAREANDGFLQKPDDVDINRDGGVIWQWCLCRPPMPARSFVALAFRFPDLSGWYADAGLPAGPQLQLIVGSDGRKLAVDKVGQAPEGWLRHESELTIALPLGGLAVDDDIRMAKMTEWSSRRVSEARQLMLAMLAEA